MLVFFIIVVLLVVYTKRDQKSPLTRSSKATMLILAVTNASYTCFVLVMDIILYAIKNRSQKLYIYGQGNVGEPYNILYNIPVVVFVFDLLATILSYLIAHHVYSINGNINDNVTDKQYYIYFCTIYCWGHCQFTKSHTIYGHSIFYRPLLHNWYADFLHFCCDILVQLAGVQWLIFDSWLRKPQSDRNNVLSRKCKCICGYSTLFLIFLSLYIVLLYTVFVYLIEIPIKPVFIAIGSVALYKLVLRRKRLWNHQNSVQVTQQLEEYKALQDHPQDTEQQPLLSPHDQ